MPKFYFHKLVRDGLPKLYAELNQKIVSRQLIGDELLEKLKEKLVEEASEVPFSGGNRDEIIDELSDIEQVLDDIKAIYGATDDEIQVAKSKKFAKKGGFKDGIFVESIELEDDDEWVQYYRKEPDKYHEVQNEPDDN